MEKIKNIIIILSLLIIALVFIIIIVKPKETNIVEEVTEAMPEENEYGFQTVDDRIMYFTVSDCVQNYLNYINPNNQLNTNKNYDEGNYEIDEENQLEYKKEVIYSLLSNNYINTNNITIDNVLNYTNNIQDYVTFIPQEMKVTYNYNLLVYIVKGIIIGNEKIENGYFIVNLDNSSSTFSIEPLIKQKYENINQINVNSVEESIEDKGFNEFELFENNYESIAEKYLFFYKKMAINYTEKAYNMLDTEYANKRFGSLNNYKEYISNNKNLINEIYLSKYQVNVNDDYNEYICIDQFNNYYIFKEINVMEYTLILDTYTLDLEEFTKKYNSSDEQMKVGMNIEKVVQAINQKDYKYVFNKLADNFKEQYFKTIDDFQKYIQYNFYDVNIIEYLNFEEQGDVYIYKVIIKDAVGDNQQTIEKNIIVKLNSNTDFVMSFNIE